jgi:hypothetical protein
MRRVGQVVVTATVRKRFQVRCRVSYHREGAQNEEMYLDLIEPLTAEHGLGDEAKRVITAADVEAAIKEMGE